MQVKNIPNLYSPLSLFEYCNKSLTLKPLSGRYSKSMDWFLYDNGLRLERVKGRISNKIVAFFTKMLILLM